MKTVRIMAVLLAAAAWLLHAECAWPQPLTAKEIVSVMNESFKPAAAACVQGKSLPDAAKLTVIIGKDGTAALESLSPALDAEVESCLAAAVEKVAFRASGQAFKMVYSYGIPAEAGPTSTEAEPNPGAAQPVPAGAGPEPVTSTEPDAASGGAATPPSAAVPMVPIMDEERPPEVAEEFKPAAKKNLERRFRVSRSLMILGFAGFGTFWISMVTTSLVLMIDDDTCVDTYYRDCPVTEGRYVHVSATAPLGGPFYSGQELIDHGYASMGGWFIANGVLQISMLAMGFAALGTMIASFKKLNRERARAAWTLVPTVSTGMHGEPLHGALLVGRF